MRFNHKNDPVYIHGKCFSLSHIIEESPYFFYQALWDVLCAFCCVCAFFWSVVLLVHKLIEVELDSKNAMAHSNLGVVLEDHEVPNVPMFMEASRGQGSQSKGSGWKDHQVLRKKDPSILEDVSVIFPGFGMWIC